MNDNEPTVGTIFHIALPKILAMRDGYFKQDWLAEQRNPAVAYWMGGYSCLRCRIRHFWWSKVGKAHLTGNFPALLTEWEKHPPARPSCWPFEHV